MFELLRKGLARPDRIPGHLRTRTVDKVRGMFYRWSAGVSDQKALFHDFVQRDEFAIVVLDACRYDYFRDRFERYISGELEPVWSTAGWTGAYVEKTWTETYDFTYLGAATHVSDHSFRLRGKRYRPSEHFDRIIQLWNTDWNPVYGTVHPENVTDAALAEATRDGPTKMVVHYMQPHSPYIGETKILPWGIDTRHDSQSIDRLARDAERRARESGKSPEDVVDRLDPADIDFETVVEYGLGPRQFQQLESGRPTDSIQSRIESGEISDRDLREAYRDNLDLVLREAKRLVSRLNCDVVLTADHGEFLGESGRYFHPPTDHPIVRKVPWLEVSDECIGTTSIEEKYRQIDLREMKDADEVSDETFESRLQALGYVD